MKNKIKILALLVLMLSINASQKTDSDYFEISKNLKLMASVYEKLNDFYVDEVLPGRVMKKGIDAMLKSLDPYTIYISESQIEDFRFTTTGEYGGIGASIKNINGKIVVSEIFENSPAQTAGVEIGDNLLQIDKTIVKDKNLNEIGGLLKGPSESIVSIKVKRNNALETFKIKREDIQIPAVSYYNKINESTGIIKLNSFTNTASEEFKKAFQELLDNNTEKLIIDLRSNGGGLLNEAVKIVNLFIPKGKLVVSTKSRIEQMNRSYFTTNKPIDIKIPIVVLIDEMSASASEIVAGSLQDLDRAVIIGNTSYGKGLVQQTKQVSFGGQIKLTVAKYYTPSGRCIQKIDYSSFEGKSKKIVDSLVQTFKTNNGRKVVDSRGIEPEVKIEPEYFSAITELLLSESIIFEFINNNISKYKNDSLYPSSFSIRESFYNEFVDFVIKKEVKYQTESHFHLKELKQAAIKEKYLKENKKLFSIMDSVFKTNVEEDLIKHKKEIKFLLENEIISRKHFHKGRVEASLKQDPYILKAEKLFKNKESYYEILGFK